MWTTAPLPGFGAEHGLSLWIEACGKKLLFDSGADGLFLENAARLGIDVGQADFAVLSHGHYDHGGGLPPSSPRTAAPGLCAPRGL